METEVWKDVKEFLGYYQVSNLGRYRSVERTVTFADGRVRTFESKILKPFTSKKGYPTATLSYKGKNYKRYVHRMVAESFLELEEGDVEVNHIDGDKLNNTASNLEWISHSDNLTHFHANSNSNSGERNNLSVLKDKDIVSIREMSSKGVSSKEISSLYEVDYKTIWRIVTYQTWKYV